MPRVGRDIYPAQAQGVEHQVIKLPPEVSLQDLLAAFREVMSRASMYTHHHVQMESLSVRERMSNVLSRVGTDRFTDFGDLFTPEEGRMGVVVTLLAILELLKESLLEMTQAEPFAPIHVKSASSACEAGEDTDTEETEYQEAMA
mgnify:FL=1